MTTTIAMVKSKKHRTDSEEPGLLALREENRIECIERLHATIADPVSAVFAVEQATKRFCTSVSRENAERTCALWMRYKFHAQMDSRENLEPMFSAILREKVSFSVFASCAKPTGYIEPSPSSNRMLITGAAGDDTVAPHPTVHDVIGELDGCVTLFSSRHFDMKLSDLTAEEYKCVLIMCRYRAIAFSSFDSCDITSTLKYTGFRFKDLMDSCLDRRAMLGVFVEGILTQFHGYEFLDAKDAVRMALWKVHRKHRIDIALDLYNMLSSPVFDAMQMDVRQ
jgi:hypothetical protein